MVVALVSGMSRHDGRQVVLLCEEGHSKMLAVGELLLLSCEARPVFTAATDLQQSKDTFVHYRDQVIDKLNHILIATRDLSSQAHSSSVQWKALSARVQELGALVTGLTELSAHIGYLMAVNLPHCRTSVLGVVNKYKVHQAKLELKYCCSRLKRSSIEDLDGHLLLELCSCMSRALSAMTEVCRTASEGAKEAEDQSQFKLCIKSITSATSCLLASIKRFRSSPSVLHLRRIIAFCDPVVSSSTALVTFACADEFIGQAAQLTDRAAELHKSVLGMTMSIVSASIQMCKALRDLVYDPTGSRHRERIRLCVDSTDKASAKLRDLLLSCQFEPRVRPGLTLASPTELRAAPGAKTSPSEGKTSPAEMKTRPSELMISPSGVKSSPGEVRTSPGEVKTSPSEVKTGPSEVKTSPGEAKTGSSEMRTGLSEAVSCPSELKTSPKEVKTCPSELKISPSELKPSPIDLKVSPVEVRISPTETKVCPAAVNTSSTEVKTSPIKVKTSPAEAKTSPMEVKTGLAEVDACHAEAQTSPTEVKTKRSEVKTGPSEAKVPELNTEASTAGEPKASPGEAKVNQAGEPKTSPGEAQVNPAELPTAPTEPGVDSIHSSVSVVGVKSKAGESDTCPGKAQAGTEGRRLSHEEQPSQSADERTGQSCVRHAPVGSAPVRTGSDGAGTGSATMGTGSTSTDTGCDGGGTCPTSAGIGSATAVTGTGSPTAVSGSVTEGIGSITAGTGSTAEGAGSDTAGTGSATEGIGSITAGTGSTTAGTCSTTDRTGSVTAGTGSTTAGTGSAVDGSGSITAGTGSTTAGTGSTSTGTGSATEGTGSTTAGTGSDRAGTDSTTTGLSSTTAGSISASSEGGLMTSSADLEGDLSVGRDDTPTDEGGWCGALAGSSSNSRERGSSPQQYPTPLVAAGGVEGQGKGEVTGESSELKVFGVVENSSPSAADSCLHSGDDGGVPHTHL